MSVFLKLFNTTAEYNAYTADTSNFILPNVSYCQDVMGVNYTPVISIENAVITCDSATYNGQTQVATNIVVTLNGNTLVSGTDYTVSNNDGGVNAGNYSFTIDGIGNYSGSKDGTFTINKVTPTVTTPTAKVLTYNGSAQELVNAGSTDYGTLQYSLDDSNYSITIPSGTNAVSYTIYYKVVGDSNVNDVAAASINNSISKVTPTVVIPVAKALTYQKGVAQELVTAGSTNYGTMKYSTDGETYSTTVPSKTKAGSYTVYYFVEGDSNVNSTEVATVACSINEKPVTATIELSQDTYTYDGSAKEPTVTVKDGGDVIDPSEYTVTYSNNTNAGTASVTITDKTAGDYNVSGVTTFTINKASRTMSWVTNPSDVISGSSITVEAAPSVGVGDGIITYSSSDTTKATVNGNIVSGAGVGSCTIIANISEGTNYLSASTSYSLTVSDYRVVGKFNVTSTSSPTQISSQYPTNPFSAIEIDGVVQPSVVSAYTFNTTGEHTVKYTLIDPTSIGYSAFDWCSGLISIDIPNSVTGIGIYAFMNCTGLPSIVIPNSVTIIGQSAFESCRSLTSCTIGSGVTRIGNSAFNYCTGLTSIDIPNSVTSIGENTFGYCSGLTSVTLGSGVTSIDQSAFSNCSSLTSITVDSNNSVYDSRNNCNAIIETSTNTLVYGCKTTMIPNTVTSIGQSAFYNCTGLTSINIPSGVTIIGYEAFMGCSGLTSIDISDSVTYIGSSAFQHCSSLTSVTIGSGVTSIGRGAFNYCSSLTSIVSNATTAPTIQNSTFQNVKTGGTLTVPSGSSGYDVWMGTGNYFLGKYGWTKVEQ